MRIIAVTREEFYNSPHSFEAVRYPAKGDSINKDHYRLAKTAVLHRWGHDEIILQSDVKIIRELSEPRGDIMVYSGRRHTGHVCPRAFSASPKGWRRIMRAWRKPGKLCKLWTPDHVVWEAKHLG